MPGNGRTVTVLSAGNKQFPFLFFATLLVVGLN